MSLRIRLFPGPVGPGYRYATPSGAGTKRHSPDFRMKSQGNLQFASGCLKL